MKKNNLLARVPGQRRLAISRLQFPNLDGFVPTAAGNLCAIEAPRHRVNPDNVRSHDTNEQKQRGVNLRGNELGGKKKYQLECPVSVDWQSPDCESQILMVMLELPLAICCPSGLHATDQTLNLREHANQQKQTETTR